MFVVGLSHPFPQTVHAVGPLAAQVIFQMCFPIQQMSRLLVLFTIAVVKDGRLADGHANDRAVLERSGPAEAVPGLRRAQENGRDVVNLMRGLSAGTLLRGPAAPAPALTGVEYQREE